MRNTHYHLFSSTLILLLNIFCSHSYHVVELSLSWLDAQEYCKNTYGTDLVTITDATMNAKITNDITYASWIGYNDIDTEGNFEWVGYDGSTFTNWRILQPDNNGGHEDCTMVSFDDPGVWGDALCSALLHFVCADFNDYPGYYPTPAPTFALGEYPGSNLLARGFNIFTATSSGSLILDEDHMQNITETYSTDGATCRYSSLQFNQQFSFYSEYAKSDSESIAAGFSTEVYGAGGSLTTSRTQTQSHAKNGQYSIYALDLKCTTASASVVEYNKLHWNPNFIDAMRILPTEYESGDSLEEYIEFWEAYGTHMFETASFGGSIHGSLISDSCAIERSFGSSTAYEECLNAAYKGIEIEGCSAESDSSSSYDAMSSSIENTYIEVKGGPLATYQSIFSEFKDKETDFSEWISDLASYPDVVGGNIDTLHDAIQRAIRLGGHLLNSALSSANAMSDEEWMAIADALETAYIYYAKDLSREHNYFGKGECSATCNGHRSNATECVCIGCKNAADCCDDAYQYKTIIVYLCVLFFALY